jgi:hypothetical protein
MTHTNTDHLLGEDVTYLGHDRYKNAAKARAHRRSRARENFGPKPVGKHRRESPRSSDEARSMYARGTTVRPPRAAYPSVFVDAFPVTIRENGHVANRSIHLALSTNQDGTKELLGLWTAESDAAKYWRAIMTELKNRGMQDVPMDSVDRDHAVPQRSERRDTDSTVS